MQPKSIDGNGNVFSDLKLDNADELFARGKIDIQVINLDPQIEQQLAEEGMEQELTQWPTY